MNRIVQQHLRAFGSSDQGTFFTTTTNDRPAGGGGELVWENGRSHSATDCGVRLLTSDLVGKHSHRFFCSDRRLRIFNILLYCFGHHTPGVRRGCLGIQKRCSRRAIIEYLLARATILFATYWCAWLRQHRPFSACRRDDS